VTVTILIAVWWWASKRSDSILFPSPRETLDSGIELIRNGTLFVDIRASLQRIAIGFVIGSGVGAALGLAIGSSEILRSMLHGPVQFFRFVPAIAWLAPAIIWFGIGETSKVLLIVYTTSFVVAVSAIAGCDDLNENKLRAARSLGANRLQVFRYVVIPGTTASILTGMRVAMGNSFMTIVAAEMLAAQSGIGFMIISARTFLDVDAIFVGIVCLGVLGFTADRFFVALIRRFGAKYYAERVAR
jgi:NitT/TauT family transport system permease protein